MRMGIMGGTLDPVHNGHIAVARAVCRACGLDGVMLLPAGDPPHKQHRADKADRWAMAQLAVGTLDWMSASDLEITRVGTTYTVDTLEQLSAAQPDVEWVYIIGADTVNVLETGAGSRASPSSARLPRSAVPAAIPAGRTRTPRSSRRRSGRGFSFSTWTARRFPPRRFATASRRTGRSTGSFPRPSPNTSAKRGCTFAA